MLPTQLQVAPRLTAVEEVSLARKIEAGVLAGDRLTSGAAVEGTLAEELRCLVSLGQQAQSRLVAANLPLVVLIAKRYATQGLEWEDLLQEGILGLMLAVEKFDFARGLKFSTLARWWIRYGITVAIGNKSRAIRIPRGVHAEINALRRVEGQMIDDHARAPTDLELAQELGCPESRVRTLKGLSRRVLSLEEPLGDVDGASILGTMSDKCVQAPLEVLIMRETGEEVVALLGELGELDREYLGFRYGFHSGKPRSPAWIRREMGLTHRDVTSIEARIEDFLQQARNLLSA